MCCLSHVRLSLQPIFIKISRIQQPPAISGQGAGFGPSSGEISKEAFQVGSALPIVRPSRVTSPTGGDYPAKSLITDIMMSR